MFGPKISIMSPKNPRFTNHLGPKKGESKNVWVKKNLGQKKILGKKRKVQKILGQKILV